MGVSQTQPHHTELQTQPHRSKEINVTMDADVDHVVDKVKVEGCGCFNLHSKKMGKPGGKSFFIKSQDGLVSASDIGWSRVKSVRTVSCENRAMPMWGVIIIVVGLVVITGVLAILGFRKYRQYRQIDQEQI